MQPQFHEINLPKEKISQNKYRIQLFANQHTSSKAEEMCLVSHLFCVCVFDLPNQLMSHSWPSNHTIHYPSPHIEINVD